MLQAMEREEEQQREYEEFLEISRLQLSVSKKVVNFLKPSHFVMSASCPE